MTTILTKLSELYARWDDLANVPVRFIHGVASVDEPFLHFEKGTSTENIWHWFEQQNPRFVVGDVMQGVRRLDVVPPAEVVHLSETGFRAGRRFCLSDGADGSRSVHAIYAPLNNPAFRSKVCDKCLAIWATEAYSDAEPMPGYIATVRAATGAREQGAASSAESGANRPQPEVL